jgi:hypothetical protein
VVAVSTPPLIRRSLVVAWLAIPLAVVGCGGSDPDGAVVLELQAIPGQPWIASGELVDAGLLCPEGFRRWTGVTHADGTPMTPEEFWEVVVPDDDMPFQAVEEYVCSDGSGSFTTIETDGASTWQVVDGTGAYVGMAGEGTGTPVFAESSEPDDPPESFRLTGAVEVAGGE